MDHLTASDQEQIICSESKTITDSSICMLVSFDVKKHVLTGLAQMEK